MGKIYYFSVDGKTIKKGSMKDVKHELGSKKIAALDTFTDYDIQSGEKVKLPLRPNGNLWISIKKLSSKDLKAKYDNWGRIKENKMNRSELRKIILEVKAKYGEHIQQEDALNTIEEHIKSIQKNIDLGSKDLQRGQAPKKQIGQRIKEYAEDIINLCGYL